MTDVMSGEITENGDRVDVSGKKPVVKAPTTIELAQRINKLERELAQTRWCFAEVIHRSRMAAAAQVLAQPGVAEQILAAIAAKIG